MLQATFRLVTPPGKRDELLDVLLCLRGPTEVMEECLRCCIVHDVENDNALTYITQWSNQESLIKHFRSERFRRLLPYIDMSVEPPWIDISRIEPIGGIDFLLDALDVRANR
jgi:quinol monooxygenase YgiN